MANTRLLTTQGFKELTEEQFKLYQQIWNSYNEQIKDDAIKLLKEWEKKYPELASHIFFPYKEIRNKNYIIEKNN
jgi:hypothetical protein